MNFVVEHLPLALPILTAILSIASRPHELRTVQGIMNVANYLALGLVTFSIWAFVAAQTANQYIVVGTYTVLNKDYSLILLLGAFIWSGFSAVVTALAEGTSEGRQKRLWQYVQGGVFAISFALMISPFFLFEQKKVIEQNLGISFDKKNFTVSIAFRDPALDHHLGFSANPLNRCEVYKSVSAQNREEAVRLALEKFNQSGSAMQFNRHAPVEIFESWIVAESEVSKPLQ